MNKHAVIPLVIGLVVGVVALKLGYDYLAKMKAKSGPDLGPVQKVVVAGKDLPLGTKLTEKDILTVYMPGKLIPDGTIKDPKDAIGQTLKLSLLAKMPLIHSMIGPGDGLEGIIPAGFRAVAVKVDEFTSVGGLLRPGVKVDVMGTFNLKNACGKSVTISKIVLQNVEVRAVGQQFQPDSGADPASNKIKAQARSITLLVKSDQAETLQLAASTGSLRLAMRSASDGQSASTTGITLNQMITPEDGGSAAGTFGNTLTLASKGKGSAFGQAINSDEPYVVEVISGGKAEQIYFASAESDQRLEGKNKTRDDLESVQAQGE